MTPEPETLEAICREIERVQSQFDAFLNREGDAALFARLQLAGEIYGLRKGLCALHGWSMEEAEKEGKADRFVDEWLSDVPPGEDPHEATREKVLAWKAKHADGPDYGFRCECGFSTRDTRYEAHVCPGAGPVGSEETTG